MAENKNNFFVEQAENVINERQEITKTVEQIQEENNRAKRILTEGSETHSPIKTYKLSDEEMRKRGIGPYRKKTQVNTTVKESTVVNENPQSTKPTSGVISYTPEGYIEINTKKGKQNLFNIASDLGGIDSNLVSVLAKLQKEILEIFMQTTQDEAIALKNSIKNIQGKGANVKTNIGLDRLSKIINQVPQASLIKEGMLPIVQNHNGTSKEMYVPKVEEIEIPKPIDRFEEYEKKMLRKWDKAKTSKEKKAINKEAEKNMSPSRYQSYLKNIVDNQSNKRQFAIDEQEQEYFDKYDTAITNEEKQKVIEDAKKAMDEGSSKFKHFKRNVSLKPRKFKNMYEDETPSMREKITTPTINGIQLYEFGNAWNEEEEKRKHALKKGDKQQAQKHEEKQRQIETMVGTAIHDDMVDNKSWKIANKVAQYKYDEDYSKYSKFAAYAIEAGEKIFAKYGKDEAHAYRAVVDIKEYEDREKAYRESGYTPDNEVKEGKIPTRPDSWIARNSSDKESKAIQEKNSFLDKIKNSISLKELDIKTDKDGNLTKESKSLINNIIKSIKDLIKDDGGVKSQASFQDVSVVDNNIDMEDLQSEIDKNKEKENNKILSRDVAPEHIIKLVMNEILSKLSISADTEEEQSKMVKVSDYVNQQIDKMYKKEGLTVEKKSSDSSQVGNRMAKLFTVKKTHEVGISRIMNETGMSEVEAKDVFYGNNKSAQQDQFDSDLFHAALKRAGYNQDSDDYVVNIEALDKVMMAMNKLSLGRGYESKELEDMAKQYSGLDPEGKQRALELFMNQTKKGAKSANPVPENMDDLFHGSIYEDDKNAHPDIEEQKTPKERHQMYYKGSQVTSLYGRSIVNDGREAYDVDDDGNNSLIEDMKVKREQIVSELNVANQNYGGMSIQDYDRFQDRLDEIDDSNFSESEKENQRSVIYEKMEEAKKSYQEKMTSLLAMIDRDIAEVERVTKEHIEWKEQQEKTKEKQKVAEEQGKLIDEAETKKEQQEKTTSKKQKKTKEKPVKSKKEQQEESVAEIHEEPQQPIIEDDNNVKKKSSSGQNKNKFKEDSEKSNTSVSGIKTSYDKSLGIKTYYLKDGIEAYYDESLNTITGLDTKSYTRRELDLVSMKDNPEEKLQIEDPLWSVNYDTELSLDSIKSVEDGLSLNINEILNKLLKNGIDRHVDENFSDDELIEISKANVMLDDVFNNSNYKLSGKAFDLVNEAKMRCEAIMAFNNITTKENITSDKTIKQNREKTRNLIIFKDGIDITSQHDSNEMHNQSTKDITGPHDESLQDAITFEQNKIEKSQELVTQLDLEKQAFERLNNEIKNHNELMDNAVKAEDNKVSSSKKVSNSVVNPSPSIMSDDVIDDVVDDVDTDLNIRDVGGIDNIVSPTYSTKDPKVNYVNQKLNQGDIPFTSDVQLTNVRTAELDENHNYVEDVSSIRKALRQLKKQKIEDRQSFVESNNYLKNLESFDYTDDSVIDDMISKKIKKNAKKINVDFSASQTGILGTNSVGYHDSPESQKRKQIVEKLRDEGKVSFKVNGELKEFKSIQELEKGTGLDFRKHQRNEESTIFGNASHKIMELLAKGNYNSVDDVLGSKEWQKYLSSKNGDLKHYTNLGGGQDDFIERSKTMALSLDDAMGNLLTSSNMSQKNKKALAEKHLVGTYVDTNTGKSITMGGTFDSILGKALTDFKTGKIDIKKFSMQLSMLKDLATEAAKGGMLGDFTVDDVNNMMSQITYTGKNGEHGTFKTSEMTDVQKGETLSTIAHTLQYEKDHNDLTEGSFQIDETLDVARGTEYIESEGNRKTIRDLEDFADKNTGASSLIEYLESQGFTVGNKGELNSKGIYNQTFTKVDEKTGKTLSVDAEFTKEGFLLGGSKGLKSKELPYNYEDTVEAKYKKLKTEHRRLDFGVTNELINNGSNEKIAQYVGAKNKIDKEIEKMKASGLFSDEDLKKWDEDLTSDEKYASYDNSVLFKKKQESIKKDIEDYEKDLNKRNTLKRKQQISGLSNDESEELKSLDSSISQKKHNLLTQNKGIFKEEEYKNILKTIARVENFQEELNKKNINSEKESRVNEILEERIGLYEKINKLQKNGDRDSLSEQEKIEYDQIESDLTKNKEDFNNFIGSDVFTDRERYFHNQSFNQIKDDSEKEKTKIQGAVKTDTERSRELKNYIELLEQVNKLELERVGMKARVDNGGFNATFYQQQLNKKDAELKAKQEQFSNYSYDNNGTFTANGKTYKLDTKEQDSFEATLAEKQISQQNKMRLFQEKQQKPGFFSNFANNIKSEFHEYLGRGLSYELVSILRQTITRAIDSIKEFDKVKIDLQIVTGYNKDQINDMLAGYNEVAKTMGVTTREVAASANQFLRMGYNAQAAGELIKQSMMLSKLGMLEASQAAEYLTSAIKGYKLSASEASKVVDMATTLDMHYAVDAGYILSAMSRTAASAKLAKVEMSELQAMIAVIGETTQKDASVVGESLKTAFARYGNVKATTAEKTDLSLINEDIDTESLDKVNDTEKVLNVYGIKLREDDGKTWRDYSDVMAEVGGQWQKYSDFEKNAISTAMFGTRQRENGIVIMENYTEVIKANEKALHSNGTASKKYETYLTGIEAAQNRLTTAWENFVLKLKGSDTLKHIYNLLAKLIEITTEWGTTILWVVGILNAKKIITGLGKFSNSFGGAIRHTVEAGKGIIKGVSSGSRDGAIGGTISKYYGKAFKDIEEDAQVKEQIYYEKIPSLLEQILSELKRQNNDDVEDPEISQNRVLERSEIQKHNAEVINRYQQQLNGEITEKEFNSIDWDSTPESHDDVVAAYREEQRSQWIASSPNNSQIMAEKNLASYRQGTNAHYQSQFNPELYDVTTEDLDDGRQLTKVRGKTKEAKTQNQNIYTSSAMTPDGNMVVSRSHEFSDPAKNFEETDLITRNMLEAANKEMLAADKETQAADKMNQAANKMDQVANKELNNTNRTSSNVPGKSLSERNLTATRGAGIYKTPTNTAMASQNAQVINRYQGAIGNSSSTTDSESTTPIGGSASPTSKGKSKGKYTKAKGSPKSNATKATKGGSTKATKGGFTKSLGFQNAAYSVAGIAGTVGAGLIGSATENTGLGVGIGAANAVVTAINPVAGAIMGLATTAIGSFFSYAKKKKEEEIKAAVEAYQKSAQEVEKYEENEDKLKRYLELTKGVNSLGNNVSLSDEEYNEFTSLGNELAETFPQLITGVDGAGNSLIGFGEKIGGTIEDLEDFAKELRKQNAEKYLNPKNLNQDRSTAYADVNDEKTEIAELALKKEYLKDIENAMNGGGFTTPPTSDSPSSNIEAKPYGDDTIVMSKQRYEELKDSGDINASNVGYSDFHYGIPENRDDFSNPDNTLVIVDKSKFSYEDQKILEKEGEEFKKYVYDEQNRTQTQIDKKKAIIGNKYSQKEREIIGQVMTYAGVETDDTTKGVMTEIIQNKIDMTLPEYEGEEGAKKLTDDIETMIATVDTGALTTALSEFEKIDLSVLNLEDAENMTEASVRQISMAMFGNTDEENLQKVRDSLGVSKVRDTETKLRERNFSQSEHTKLNNIDSMLRNNFTTDQLGDLLELNDDELMKIIEEGSSKGLDKTQALKKYILESQTKTVADISRNLTTELKRNNKDATAEELEQLAIDFLKHPEEVPEEMKWLVEQGNSLANKLGMSAEELIKAGNYLSHIDLGGASTLNASEVEKKYASLLEGSEKAKSGIMTGSEFHEVFGGNPQYLEDTYKYMNEGMGFVEASQKAFEDAKKGIIGYGSKTAVGRHYVNSSNYLFEEYFDEDKTTAKSAQGLVELVNMMLGTNYVATGASATDLEKYMNDNYFEKDKETQDAFLTNIVFGIQKERGLDWFQSLEYLAGFATAEQRQEGEKNNPDGSATDKHWEILKIMLRDNTGLFTQFMGSYELNTEETARKTGEVIQYLSELTDAMNKTKEYYDYKFFERDWQKAQRDYKKQQKNNEKERKNILKEQRRFPREVEKLEKQSKDLDTQERLNVLENYLQKRNLLIEEYDNKINNSEWALELISPNDYMSKFDIVGEKFMALYDKNEELKAQYEELASMTPISASEAQKISDTMKSLSQQMQNNNKELLLYEKTFRDLAIETIADSINSVTEAFENQKKALESTVNATMSFTGLESNLDLLGLNINPLIDNIDEIDEKRNMYKTALAEQEDYQNRSLASQRNYLELLSQEQVEEIRNQRLDLIEQSEDLIEREKDLVQQLLDLDDSIEDARNDFYKSYIDYLNQKLTYAIELRSNPAIKIEFSKQEMMDAQKFYEEAGQSVEFEKLDNGRYRLLGGSSKENDPKDDEGSQNKQAWGAHEVPLSSTTDSGQTFSTQGTTYQGNNKSSKSTSGSGKVSVSTFDGKPSQSGSKTTETTNKDVSQGTTEVIEKSIVEGVNNVAVDSSEIKEASKKKINEFLEAFKKTWDEVVTELSNGENTEEGKFLLDFVPLLGYQEDSESVSALIEKFKLLGNQVAMGYAQGFSEAMGINISSDAFTTDDNTGSWLNAEDGFNFQPSYQGNNDENTNNRMLELLVGGLDTEAIVSVMKEKLVTVLEELVTAWNDTITETEAEGDKYKLGIPSLSGAWTDFSDKENTDYLIGAMFTAVRGALGSAVLEYQNNVISDINYQLPSPNLLLTGENGWGTEGLIKNMIDKINEAIDYINTNENNEIKTLFAPEPDEASWTSFGEKISLYISQGIDNGIQNGLDNQAQSAVGGSSVVHGPQGMSSGSRSVVGGGSMASGSGDQILRTASTQLGVPYKYGGITPSGFDCSGLMKWAYAQHGITIPRTADQQWRGNGELVDRENLQVGDLLFFNNNSDPKIDHVGMYVGNNKMLHAPSTGKNVEYKDLTDWYWNRFVGAKRYHTGGSPGVDTLSFDSSTAMGRLMRRKAVEHGFIEDSPLLYEGLGSLSAKYEVGGYNAGKIANNVGDYGGKSYGIPQFSLSRGSLRSFVNWLKANYPNIGDQLTASLGSLAFDSQWRKIAENHPSFGSIQQEYGILNFVNPQKDKILRQYGLDMTRSRALYEALISAAYQYNNITPSLLSGYIEGMTDREILDLIYTNKKNNVGSHFRSSSSDIQNSVRNRITNEYNDVLAFLSKGTKYHKGGPALLGDENFLKGKDHPSPETLIYPNGRVELVGEDGPVIKNIPKGTQVLTTAQTKQLFKNLPHYSDGTSVEVSDTVTDSNTEVSDNGSSVEVTTELTNEQRITAVIEHNEEAKDNPVTEASLGLSENRQKMSNMDFNNLSSSDIEIIRKAVTEDVDKIIAPFKTTAATIAIDRADIGRWKKSRAEEWRELQHASPNMVERTRYASLESRYLTGDELSSILAEGRLYSNIQQDLIDYYNRRSSEGASSIELSEIQNKIAELGDKIDASVEASNAWLSKQVEYISATKDLTVALNTHANAILDHKYTLGILGKKTDESYYDEKLKNNKENLEAKYTTYRDLLDTTIQYYLTQFADQGITYEQAKQYAFESEPVRQAMEEIYAEEAEGKAIRQERYDNKEVDIERNKLLNDFIYNLVGDFSNDFIYSRYFEDDESSLSGNILSKIKNIDAQLNDPDLKLSYEERLELIDERNNSIIEYFNSFTDGVQAMANKAQSLYDNEVGLLENRENIGAIDTKGELAQRTNGQYVITGQVFWEEKIKELDKKLSSDEVNLANAEETARQKALSINPDMSESELEKYINNDETVVQMRNNVYDTTKQITAARAEELEYTKALIDNEQTLLDLKKSERWASKESIDEFYKSNEELIKSKITEIKAYLETANLSREEYDAKRMELAELERELFDNDMQKLKDVQEFYNSQYESMKYMVNEYIDALNDEKDVIEEVYDEEIDKLKEINEQKERNIKLTELQTALENAKKEKKRIYRAGVGFVYEEDREAISQAEQELEDFYRQDRLESLNKAKDLELKALDERIEGWNKYLEAIEKVYKTAERHDHMNRLEKAWGVEGWSGIWSNLDSDLTNYLTNEDTGEKIYYGSQTDFLERYIDVSEDIYDKMDETVELLTDIRDFQTSKDINKVDPTISPESQNYEKDSMRLNDDIIDPYVEEWKKYTDVVADFSEVAKNPAMLQNLSKMYGFEWTSDYAYHLHEQKNNSLMRQASSLLQENPDVAMNHIVDILEGKTVNDMGYNYRDTRVLFNKMLDYLKISEEHSDLYTKYNNPIVLDFNQVKTALMGSFTTDSYIDYDNKNMFSLLNGDGAINRNSDAYKYLSEGLGMFDEEIFSFAFNKKEGVDTIIKNNDDILSIIRNHDWKKEPLLQGFNKTTWEEAKVQKSKIAENHIKNTTDLSGNIGLKNMTGLTDNTVSWMVKEQLKRKGNLPSVIEETLSDTNYSKDFLGLLRYMRDNDLTEIGGLSADVINEARNEKIMQSFNEGKIDEATKEEWLKQGIDVLTKMHSEDSNVLKEVLELGAKDGIVEGLRSFFNESGIDTNYLIGLNNNTTNSQSPSDTLMKMRGPIATEGNGIGVLNIPKSESNTSLGGNVYNTYNQQEFYIDKGGQTIDTSGINNILAQ